MKTLPALLRPSVNPTWLAYPTTQNGYLSQACFLGSVPSCSFEAKCLRMEKGWWSYYSKKFYFKIGTHRIIVFLPTPLYVLVLSLLFLASSFAAADGILHTWVVFSPGLDKDVFLKPALYICRQQKSRIVPLPRASHYRSTRPNIISGDMGMRRKLNTTFSHS